MTTALKIHTQTATTTKAIGDVTAAGGIGAVVPAAAGAYRDLLGGQETRQDAETLRLLGALVTMLGGNRGQFNALLQEILAGQQGQAAATAQLQGLMNHAAQQQFNQ